MALAIPTSPDELEAVLNDRAKLQELGSDPKAFGEFIGRYTDSLLAKDRSIKEQMQAQLAEYLKANPGVRDGRLPLHGALGADSAETRTDVQVRRGLYSPEAPGHALNGIFKRQSDFLRAMSPKLIDYQNRKELEEGINVLSERMHGVRNSFSTNVPSDGGFLVPEQFRSDLLMWMLEASVFEPLTTRIPMETQRTLIPTVDSTGNASSVFGGIVCYWVDEATAPTESNAKFGQIVLDAKKLMAYCTAPQELVADATAFEAFLRAALPAAMAFERDYRIARGTGAGEPLGFVNCDAAVIASAVSGQGSNTIVVENLAAMYARMLPTSLNNAVWLASIDTFPQLATMALSVGTGGAPVWLTNGGVAGAPPMSIYGRPVLFTEKLPSLGTTGDIMFTDLSFYLLGDRQVMQASASSDFLFSSDRIAYKVIQRLDGKPWLQSAITPKNSGNNLSPFVQLSSTRT